MLKKGTNTTMFTISEGGGAESVGNFQMRIFYHFTQQFNEAGNLVRFGPFKACTKMTLMFQRLAEICRGLQRC